MTFSPIRIIPGLGIDVIDQTRLPHEEVWLELRDLDALCEAVLSLRVRGAPLLGLVAAAGMAMAGESGDTSEAALTAARDRIAAVRPTAVELASLAFASCEAALAAGPEPSLRRRVLWEFLAAHLERREREDAALSALGAEILPDDCSALTHCNTGSLATGGAGTALGVVEAAFRGGKLTRCYATETRPLLQGARLTMWELQKMGVPAILLPDTAAAALIASGKVQAVITGADRIARNGDTANKVGTYGLAAVAARHHVPFYIAAPTTTFDPACPDGADIPIEYRSDSEVGGFGAERWTVPGAAAFNPAFDVTPGELVTAFITEAGVVRPPYGDAITRLLAGR